MNSRRMLEIGADALGAMIGLAIGLVITAVIIGVVVRFTATRPSAEPRISPEAAAKTDEDPFTIKCKTTYNFKGNTSYISFDVTVNPRQGIYFQHNWYGDSNRPDGKYHFDKRHKGMTNEVRYLHAIDGEKIRSGLAILDRDTGKYTFGLLPVVVGSCAKTRYHPIPSNSF